MPINRATLPQYGSPLNRKRDKPMLKPDKIPKYYAHTLPHSFRRPRNGLWNTDNAIVKGHKLYWEPRKTVKEMTPRERDRELAKHVTRWKRGGHPG